MAQAQSSEDSWWNPAFSDDARHHLFIRRPTEEERTAAAALDPGNGFREECGGATLVPASAADMQHDTWPRPIESEGLDRPPRLPEHLSVEVQPAVLHASGRDVADSVKEPGSLMAHDRPGLVRRFHNDTVDADLLERSPDPSILVGHPADRKTAACQDRQGRGFFSPGSREQACKQAMLEGQRSVNLAAPFKQLPDLGARQQDESIPGRGDAQAANGRERKHDVPKRAGVDDENHALSCLSHSDHPCVAAKRVIFARTRDPPAY